MTCPIDARPLSNNAVICATCEDNLARALGDLDALLDDLDTTLTRQSKRRPSRGNGAADGPPLPYDERASEAARDLRTLLKDWVSLVAEGLADEGRFVALPMPATAKSLASWLMHHTHWIATHETAADAYTEIVGAVNNIRRTIDIAPDIRFIGPCGSVLDDVECTDTLYAIEGSQTARCKTCGTTWDINERKQAATTQARYVAATSAFLSQTLAIRDEPLTPDRIRKWAYRGHLAPVGTGPRGHPTYIVAHVARLIRMYENGEKLSPWNQEQETA